VALRAHLVISGLAPRTCVRIRLGTGLVALAVVATGCGPSGVPASRRTGRETASASLGTSPATPEPALSYYPEGFLDRGESIPDSAIRRFSTDRGPSQWFSPLGVCPDGRLVVGRTNARPERPDSSPPAEMVLFDTATGSNRTIRRMPDFWTQPGDVDCDGNWLVWSENYNDVPNWVIYAYRLPDGPVVELDRHSANAKGQPVNAHPWLTPSVDKGVAVWHHAEVGGRRRILAKYLADDSPPRELAAEGGLPAIIYPWVYYGAPPAPGHVEAVNFETGERRPLRIARGQAIHYLEAGGNTVVAMVGWTNETPDLQVASPPEAEPRVLSEPPGEPDPGDGSTYPGMYRLQFPTVGDRFVGFGSSSLFDLKLGRLVRLERPPLLVDASMARGKAVIWGVRPPGSEWWTEFAVAVVD